MEIPIPPCNNNRRTSMKCRRMCCKRPKVKPVSTTQQTILCGPTRPSKNIHYWTDYADI